MAGTITLIPINCGDRELMRIMTRAESPRWMKVAACLAMERRKLVLIKDGLDVVDTCPSCGSGEAIIRGVHKNAFGGDPRCLLCCRCCGNITESRPLISLERTLGAAMQGFRDAF